MKSLQNKFLIAFLALAGIASVLWAITHYSGMVVHPYLPALLRWAAIVAFLLLCLLSAHAYAMDLCRNAGGRGNRL